MVRLRLRRKGRTHHPVYDIVAVDGRKKRDGAFLERLGYYDPHYQPSTIKIDAERAIYWLNNGAQPSDLVRELMSYEGVLLRRALQFKGKSEEEIDAEVEKHKEVAKERYFRRKELRKQKAIAKEKAKEEAEKAEKEAEAKAAEAPAEKAE
jgi:small subunit ribosomal protein S16